jgi:hypothetical protein
MRLFKRINLLSIIKLYKVLKSILLNRITNRTPRNEIRPNYIKLFKIKEEVIIRNILNLDSRGFVPRLTSVEDIVNFILELKEGERVGKL